MPSLVRTVAPTDTPVSVEQIKAYLRLDHDRDDEQLELMLASALDSIESVIGWQFCVATFALALDAFPQSGEVIRPPRAPLAAVSAITYWNESNQSTTWNAALYEVDAASLPGRIRPVKGQSWPTAYERFNAVTITFNAGCADVGSVPGWVKQALLVEVATRYENRLNDGNIITNLPGFHAAETTRLIMPHRLAWNFGQGLDCIDDDE